MSQSIEKAEVISVFPNKVRIEIRPELIRSDVRQETHQELASRLRGQTIIKVADHLLGGRIE